MAKEEKQLTQEKIDDKFEIAWRNLESICKDKDSGMCKKLLEKMEVDEAKTVSRMMFHKLYKDGHLEVSDIKLVRN